MKQVASWLMLIMLLVGMISSEFNIQVVRAGIPTIIVPIDYPTIQEAINNADEGDRIFVLSGTYYENVVINKTVSLVGADEETTIIDGNLNGKVALITANNVTVKGFTIQHSRMFPPISAIHLVGVQNCVIAGNIVRNNGLGVCLQSGSGNVISNNTISDSLPHHGIELLGGINNNVIGNNVLNCSTGIELREGSRNSIQYNNLLDNRYQAIYLGYTSNNSIKNNELNGNANSLTVVGGGLSDFFQDIDTSNVVDGKILYYLTNKRDLVIDQSTFPDIGYLGLVNSTRVLIKDFMTERSGIMLANVTHSTLMNTTSSRIVLWYSQFNLIKRNVVSNNADNNIIVLYSQENEIIENEIKNAGGHGIVLQYSKYDRVYHNNFINNVRQVSLSLSNNIWDDGCEGNYWSNYNGTDSDGDGIGDTPYVIDENNQDNYPLMSPYLLGDINHDGIVDDTDLISLREAYGSEFGDDNWNCHSDLNEDGVIDTADLFELSKNYGETT